MPILGNSRHELFAQELAKGSSADAAYVAAGYNANRGNASTLKQSKSISARVAEILAEREAIHGQATADAIKSVGLTKEWVIERLIQNVDRAMQVEEVKDREGNGLGEFQYQGSVANRALELLGKEVGMFIDRKEVGKPGEFDNLDADERKRLLETIDKELAGRQGDVAEPGPARQTGPVSSLH